VSSIVDVERPMFQKHISHVDELLERGIRELTWEDEGAPAFLKESVEKVSRFNELHNTSTSKITRIKVMIESWRETPLFSRLDPKKSFDQNEMNNMLNARIALIIQQSQRISQLVKSSVAELTENPDSPGTHQCLDYIASLIREEFTGSIMDSFSALLKDLSAKPFEQGSVRPSNVVPLITMPLELVGNVVFFSPPLKDGNDNLYPTLKDWCQRALDLAKFIDVFYDGQGTILNDI
jgi:hypothetical protein